MDEFSHLDNYPSQYKNMNKARRRILKRGRRAWLKEHPEENNAEFVEGIALRKGIEE
jgi:hypothetical protein